METELVTSRQGVSLQFDAPSLKTRIALISPSDGGSRSRHAASLGIRSLASYIEDPNIEIRVFDAHCWGWSADETARAVVDFAPDLVGIQLIFYRQLVGLDELIQRCSGTSTDRASWFAGGHVATFSPAEILGRVPKLGFVVRGEGEVPFSKIAELSSHGQLLSENYDLIPNLAYMSNGRLTESDSVPLMPNLDKLPFPTFLSVDSNDERPASIMGSRGCYATCEFCSVPAFFKLAAGPLWRLRSAANLVDEIEKLNVEFGVKKFSFLDDIFLAKDTRSKRRALEIAREIKARSLNIHFSIECRSDAIDHSIFAELKSAGLARVFLGLEAGSENVLNRYKKMSGINDNHQAIRVLKELDIAIGVGFIMFNPEITLDELSCNIDFLHSHCMLTARSISNKLRAYPGTPIYSRLLEADRLFGDPLYPDYAFESQEVEDFYKFVRKVSDEFDFIDLKLLKLEYQAAGNPELEEELTDIKSAYSRDLFRMCNNFLDQIKSKREVPMEAEFAVLREKWDNDPDG